MKSIWLIGTFVILSTSFGCGGETQKIQPSSLGQRGESCQARNDCASGLACISGTCSRNDFDVSVTAKHCDEIECETAADCCGDRPTVAPAECANRDAICQSTLPGCDQYATCTSDAECGGSTCGTGYCTNSSTSCLGDADCADTCVAGLCTLSSASCVTSTDCYYGTGTCYSRYCSCDNPQYDPTNPICSNPDCYDLCTLTCQDERCVVDNSCASDLDCNYPTPNCNAGKCVECIDDTECSSSLGESCVAGVCKAPCTQNEECPLFHQCQSGECVETGCTTDRECILAASNGSSSYEDPRLSKCLPSDENPDIKECKIPCENDGACRSMEACDHGYCKFIGCNTDEECRAYLGLEDEQSTGLPYVPKAVCRE